MLLWKSKNCGFKGSNLILTVEMHSLMTEPPLSVDNAVTIAHVASISLRKPSRLLGRRCTGRRTGLGLSPLGTRSLVCDPTSVRVGVNPFTTQPHFTVWAWI